MRKSIAVVLLLMSALLLFINLLVPLARADQTLIQGATACGPYGIGSELYAEWVRPTTGCKKSAYNIQPSFYCIGDLWMQTCVSRCQDCDVKIYPAYSITVDNACVNVTSHLWVRKIYVSGKGWT